MAGSVGRKSMIELKKLEEHREEILLAEVAAWLHDIGKATSLHLKHSVEGDSFEWPCDFSYKIIIENPSKVFLFSSRIDSLRKPDIINDIRNQNCLNTTAASELPGILKDILVKNFIKILNDKYSLAELIILGTPGFATHENRTNIFERKDGWLPALLGLCHSVAHHDKQEPKKTEGNQQYPIVYISSPFGFENETNSIDIRKIQSPLDEKLFNNIVQKEFIKLLKQRLGDTRRPINEIRLSNWGHTVASLFVAELAAVFLTGLKHQINGWKNYREKIIDTDIKWRLLNIRFDGLSFLFKNAQIPDLLARRDLLNNALDKVQNLLEEAYPLGLEVYRDENGSLFVIPDIKYLLETAVDTDKNNLYHLILNTFNQGTVKDNFFLRIEGELIPLIEPSEPWNGMGSSLPPVGDCLKEIPVLEADLSKVSNWWSQTKPEELCIVCGLRPQGPDPKAKSRNVCNVCEERRADRSEDWVANLGKTTIWVNEVADVNGRYFLLVGAFDLKKWLSGELVYSLAVRNPEKVSDKSYKKIAKNPSFARMRRIWETTRRFWQEVLPTDEMFNFKESLVAKVLRESGPRLALRGNITDGKGKPKTPGRFHAYELITEKGYKLSVVWDANKKRFILADNLVYVARIIGKHLPKRDEKEKDEEYKKELNKCVATELKQVFQGKLKIEEPTGYGATNKEFGTLEVEGVPEIIEGSGFIPAIPILAEPRTFMALLPANKALDIIKAIKEKYEREMGKVRNRLPLHLGIVFAHRRTPLRAVLDAGKRMLEQKNLGEVDEWVVKDDVKPRDDDLSEKAQKLSEKNNQFKKWYEVQLQHKGLKRKISWYVPAVMGDGETDDHWYPYVFLDTTSEPSDRNRYFKAPNPWEKNEECWLVHAGELKEGDKVYFTPATFDFDWLDVSARRFEIAYEKENGQRKGRLTRPYLLDELTELNEIWEALSTHLTKNQIYAIRDTIEDRRKEWQPDEKDLKENDGMFWQFCRDVILNANWKNDPWPKKERDKWLNKWATYAARGWLTDVVELHFHIMKEKIETKQTEEVTT